MGRELSIQAASVVPGKQITWGLFKGLKSVKGVKVGNAI